MKQTELTCTALDLALVLQDTTKDSKEYAALTALLEIVRGNNEN